MRGETGTETVKDGAAHRRGEIQFYAILIGDFLVALTLKKLQLDKPRDEAGKHDAASRARQYGAAVEAGFEVEFCAHVSFPVSGPTMRPRSKTGAIRI